MTDTTNQQGTGDAVLAATLSAVLEALNDMRVTLKSVNNQLSGGAPSLTLPSSQLPPSHSQSVSGTSGSLVSELPPAIVDITSNVSHSAEIAASTSPALPPTAAPTDPAHPTSLLLGAAPPSPAHVSLPSNTTTGTPSLAPTGLAHEPLPITVTTTTVTTSSTSNEPMPGSGPDVPTPAEVRSQLQGIPSAASSRWFVVTSGTAPGVYKSWDETSPLVIGISRAVYTKHPTKGEALTAYQTSWEHGHVIRRPG
ncbi:hypothetical protein F5887DRAFT_1079647 [Amanita rubescens]|nr:hypothetical protein F5887DRAFT_1079647 [Amanita rubescens]